MIKLSMPLKWYLFLYVKIILFFKFYTKLVFLFPKHVVEVADLTVYIINYSEELVTSEISF